LRVLAAPLCQVRSATGFRPAYHNARGEGGQSITRKRNVFGAKKGFGWPIKIVSIVDEQTRESLGAMVERNITGEHLIGELSRLAT
jgi:hypothetical protein